MEHKASFKNYTKRNIPGALSFAITLLYSIYSITNELNRAECGYQVHGTERKISHLLYMDDLKLVGNVSTIWRMK